MPRTLVEIVTSIEYVESKEVKIAVVKAIIGVIQRTLDGYTYSSSDIIALEEALDALEKK